MGRSVPRREGHDKVTGATAYVDDLSLPGMWHGVTVRSPVARARLLGVELGEGVPWHEFAIVGPDDLPGPNVVKLIDTDQPLLAADEIRHCDEPVLLLAHPDRAMAERGRAAVRLRLEPLPAVTSLDDALRGDVVVWGRDNVFREYRTAKGDVDAALADPDVVVVEGVYETGAQEQMYIEPQGMIAQFDAERGVTVRGSLQCPYYVHAALVALFQLPPQQVRVIQTATGGGFGGKEEYPSVIAAHAAVLARKAGHPVKLIYDRVEDVRATTKRHPSRTHHRTAVRRDGTLVAMDIDFIIDGGAYLTLSPVVLSRGAIHSAGPYRCEHVRIRARAIATSHPPHGAFRGFGAPQSVFALERHLDVIAARLGLDPAALRRKNLLQPGEQTAVGQVVREPIALDRVLDRALALSHWHERRAAHEAFNRSTDGPLRRGIGVATFMHGAGFTGAGEVHLASVAQVQAERDGTLTVLAASTEIGQGTNTVFAQIVADAAGLPLSRVRVGQPDTAVVPDSGPTVASRTTMVVGTLLRRATASLRQTLRDAGLLPAGTGPVDPEVFTQAVARYLADHEQLRGEARYEPPPGIAWDEKAFRGDAYASYAWAAYVADVTVDLRTAEVRVDDFVAVQEVGRVVNPVLAAGQIEGGVAQAIGWALFEQVVYRDGRVANPQMTNYIIPTAVDTPPIRVEFMPPFLGDDAPSKGIGELPMDGPAPAILAAVQHATGAVPTAIPMLPEQLAQVLQEAQS
ncbi:MAG: xanthine dehydrogenase family protein molybdopterin-binding subunit [Nannocystaceae bacterium]|nr:xanthine dehydrogenase family protein molybdopterin-binding subunit [Nannocystaceae bacterium]